MEGKSRPAHFRGVTTVVLKFSRLRSRVAPFLGARTPSKSSLSSSMVRDLNLDVEIATCPIIREPEGLALSSRNVYLSAGRTPGSLLYRSLLAAKAEIVRRRTQSRRILATLARSVASLMCSSITRKSSMRKPSNR